MSNRLPGIRSLLVTLIIFGSVKSDDPRLHVCPACLPCLSWPLAHPRLRASHLLLLRWFGLACSPSVTKFAGSPIFLSFKVSFTNERHIQIRGEELLDGTLLVNHGSPLSSSPRSYFSTLYFELLGNLVGVGAAAVGWLSEMSVSSLHWSSRPVFLSKRKCNAPDVACSEWA